MADFTKHIDPLVEKEGGYRLIHIPGDNGGRTYAGISERSNQDWEGWALLENGAPIEDMIEAVHSRYRERYWMPIMGDQLASDDVAEMLFSSAVLSGPRRAIRMAQD